MREQMYEKKKEILGFGEGKKIYRRRDAEKSG